MTIAWFVVWFVADLVGDHAPLRLYPPNWWTVTLLLVIALDLNRPSVTRRGK